MNISRRNLLKLGVGAAAACVAGAHRSRVWAAADGRQIPIGLQLYSVRNECEKNLPPVIEAVAKMGYKGVEFAGYYGRNADELRKLLDASGLKCCGTHTGLNTIIGEQLKATVEFNRTLGNKYLIVPGLPQENTKSVQALIDTAKLLTEVAAKVKPQGLRVGYHAHGGDFKKVDGQMAWDVLFTNAGPDVVMQLDLGNCLGGGGDPYATLKKYPGRSATIHLKEHGGKPGACVGEGDVKWTEVFQLCETSGNTEWYIVEQESYDGGPLDSIRRCFENLKKMGKC